MCKKLFCLTPFVVVLALAGNAAAQLDPAAVDTGHVYLFEDVTGGQLQDDSSNSHTGTVLGGPEATAGLRGNALQFDGANLQIEDLNQATLAEWRRAFGQQPADMTVLAGFHAARRREEISAEYANALVDAVPEGLIVMA